MNRDKHPREGTAAEATAPRPSPLLVGDNARYHSRGIGYFDATVVLVHPDGRADVEVVYPVSAIPMVMKRVVVHRGVPECPKGDCIL